MEWKISDQPVEYEQAISFMEDRVAAVIAGAAEEMVWLLEHPPLYTAGSSANPEDLLDSKGFPVYSTGRGGQYTYHGPGQRVAYVMLNLRKRGADIRAYVKNLEECVIQTLAAFGIKAEAREGRVGVWVNPPEAKIAAIGVRIRQWVTYHGVAVNICPDLNHYNGIVPCGIREYGVTSMQALGVKASAEKFDTEFQKAFEKLFEKNPL